MYIIIFAVLKKGLKLEANDRRFPYYVCVATVEDVQGTYLSICILAHTLESVRTNWRKIWGQGRDGQGVFMIKNEHVQPPQATPTYIPMHIYTCLWCIYLYATSLNQSECNCNAVAGSSKAHIIPYAH